MNRRSRSTRPTAPAGGTGSDIDALQTDVMRFMSILGLCLMAVFALVQSMPRGETSPIPLDPEPEEVRRGIEMQQERAVMLQADLKHLTAQIEIARARSDSAQQAAASKQRELRLLVDQTEQVRRERDRLRAELAVLHRELTLSRTELDEIQRAAVNRAATLGELQRRLGEAQKDLDSISRRASDLSRKAKGTATSAVVAKPPSPAKQGFTLRFASAKALHRLVRAETVSLYAMAGERTWRLSLRDDKAVFAATARPDWFHEMASTTVPREYVQSLEKLVTQQVRPAVVWGVQLPTATRQGIRSLSRGLPGGDLVIADDGRVRLAAD